MKIQSLEELFLTSLQYVYDAEKQLTEALPKMAKASTTSQLSQAFEAHLKETHGHVKRAEHIFSAFGKKATTRSNTVVEAMGKEADGMVKNTEAGPIRDAALIEAANQVEHWEMAAYLSLRNFAQLLGQEEVAGLLEQTLNEEKQAAAKVIEIGENYVNSQAAHRHATAGAR